MVNYNVGQEFIGFNGFPKGVVDSYDRYANRELKQQFVVHAEVNALLKAGPLARSGTLYVWPSFSQLPVCNECAKVAIQAGIKEVVSYTLDLSNPQSVLRAARWASLIGAPKTMFEESGISWRTVEELNEL